jgi:ABC-type transport system involved in multi-copper enzyme maturation permease subunit
MWRSLVWKEWHEQRWRLWFGAALLGMFTLIGLRTRIMPDEQIVVMGSMLLGGMLFPLMVAMGLVAPERAEGTLVRLLALPVPAWKVLAAKGLIGAIVCTGPVLVSAAIAAVVAGDREMAWSQFAQMYAMAIGMTLSTFAWLTAAGVRQPSEARAGLMGIGVGAGWFLVIATSSMLAIELFHDQTVMAWVAAFSPFGLTVLRGGDAPPAVVIGIQLVMFAVVWAWAAWRIGKPGKVVA